MKKIIKTSLAAFALVLGLISSLQAEASVIIAGTRVVYDAKERETTVRLTNNGKFPSLTQTWIDKGDPNAMPATIDVPFTVTPPVARIEAGKSQTLRIIHTGDPMPSDKESLFWLNVLEVPPKPSAADEGANLLQMAFRTRIKLFFRPAELQGNAEDAAAQVNWRLIRKDGKPALEGRNPTPFHVTFAALELVADGNSAKSIDSGMIDPGGTAVFPLAADVKPGLKALVHYQYVNDFGGAVAAEKPLDVASQSPAP